MILEKKEYISNVIDNSDINYWELHNDVSYWSKAFINELGYKHNKIDTKLGFFLKHLIHPNDRNIFKDHFFGLVEHKSHFKQKISIRNKAGKYEEYNCRSNEKLAINTRPDSDVIFFFKKKLKTAKVLRNKHLFYRETAEMTATGSWFVDFVKQKSYWDSETRRILEYPEDYIPSLKEGPKYFTKPYREKASQLFLQCGIEGKSFDTEIEMLTANGRSLWVRSKGKPVYNDFKKIIGIRGVFQDIDIVKQKQNKLEETSDIITSQNSRLYNFAHIVSHNLRSHTSNLELITQLIDDTENKEEKIELVEQVKIVSKSLSQTIEHLNEIVTVQTKIDQTKELLYFDDVLKHTKNTISQFIFSEKAEVISDFTEATSINYIPAYLESIVLNLITNAIKYKHPDRTPKVQLKTYETNNKIVLEVVDNGVGIDLDKFGTKIFGMYKTFHYNSDAVGIGLFLVKNQVEALNGTITVESEVNKGTTFKITF